MKIYRKEKEKRKVFNHYFNLELKIENVRNAAYKDDEDDDNEVDVESVESLMLKACVYDICFQHKNILRKRKRF